MKKIKMLFLLIGFYITLGANAFNVCPNLLEDSRISLEKIKNGDLIFQTSLSSQSMEIQLATKSKYSHCGIVYIIKGKQYVYEAIEPVQYTPLIIWINRGENKKYCVKRLKNSKAILTEIGVKKMITYGNQFKGRSYDLQFNWSDDKLYCSELLWKVYKNGAGITLCKLQHLSDFDLKNKKVMQLLKKRYGARIPLNEEVVSPSDIMNSELLETVY